MTSPQVKTARRTGSGFTSPFLPTAAQIAHIHRITRTGILPPNSSSLQATVSLAKTELRRYDSEIDKLRTELNRLVSERETLFSYSASCRSVLSALQRLPNEVLVSIFEFCFPHDEYQLGTQTSEKSEVRRISQYHLLQLGQVSFRWHQIAMETPQLWSALTVDTSIWEKLTGASSKDLLKLLECSLTRSGNHALDLQLNLASAYGYGDSVFQLFRKSAHRWRDVFIRSRGQPICSPINLEQLEKLERLQLDVGWKIAESVEAPRLRDFTFRGRADCLPSLPWNQLHECNYYSTDRPPTLSPLSVLRTANNSAAFRLDFNLGYLPLVDKQDIKVSSNVHSLALELDTDDKSVSVERLFDSLTLPRLEAFEYRPSRVVPPIWSPDRFMALAERSAFATHLISLSVHARITDEELLVNLALLPRLEELFVADSHTTYRNNTVVTDTFLRGLLCVPKEAPLVPELRALKFLTVFEFTDEVYVELVASRIERFKAVDANSKGAFEAKIQGYMGRRKVSMSKEALQKLKSFAFEGALLFKCVAPLR
ncbi:hypothetical protein R3P38DRAFT_3004012 [Favolaschia claudopus]|uniref:F-box domain-containing protein n=1 Tax=Favolaschia claudopus TaxID=2862362 RepID=A0AAW0ALW9_9AGAR